MSRSYADMPLHYGQVPAWLYTRMGKLGVAITEAIIIEYGKSAFLQRMSDPFWFQSLGAVLGMDWHSSGITTSVMGALKQTVNQRSKELGIYICGGKGRHSRETPNELIRIADSTGMDGQMLVRSSKLAAKVDNTGIQDGYQIYLHSWHSPGIRSFVEEPHTSIYGKNEGLILNITDKQADTTRTGVLNITKENPELILNEARKLFMPRHHDVKAKDVDLKRLGSVLAVAHEKELADMESLLLLEGVGPRTLQSLVLVSEMIHGTPTRFEDPARYSFAHGGKDGHPFPVPTKVYDETISVLDNAIRHAKLGDADKNEAIKNLHKAALRAEENFVPNNNFEQLVQKERNESWKYGGRTVFGKSVPPAKKPGDNQLKLF